ncbi:uncharacterized protein [Clytia hemisphaerica]|uniref:uncharacterized protein isoform X1 n=1 Tax=Clytia hemisphaerica TaxID=252671 RepID=UPI0034D6BF80
MVAFAIVEDCLLNGFVVGRSLGEGAFGMVKQATFANFNHPNDSLAKRLRSLGLSDQVAIKIMPKSLGIETVKTELNCMLALNGTKNTVQLLKFFQGSMHVYFVLEFCSGGDLANFVFNKKPQNTTQIFKEIAFGVQQCHQKNITHRDLKLSNILIDQNGVIKIADFGLGFIKSTPEELCEDYCGTPGYLAPEVERGYNLLSYDPYDGFKADMYSLGVILYKLLTGKYPHKAWIKDCTFSSECRDLLKILLHESPNSRPTIGDVSNHPFLTPEAVVKDQKKEKLDNVTNKELDNAEGEQNNKKNIIMKSKRQIFVTQDVRNKMKNKYNLRTVFIANNVTFKNQMNVVVNFASNAKFPNGHHFPSTEQWE